jgi:hypothetical protein
MNELKKEQYYWWLSKDDSELCKSVFSYVNHLDKNQSYRAGENYKFLRMYGNADIYGFGQFNFSRAETSYATQNRVTLNVVQSMIDTVVSKITKNQPRPMFLTEGGDWSIQRKAEKLTQFVEGQFYYTDFYQKAAQAFQDSTIFGTGCLKIFRDGSDIKVERVFIDEIKTDDAESIYGSPRQMHQSKWIHRDVLKAAFPDKAEWIELAQRDSSEEYIQKSTWSASTDMIKVVESWHLPSGKDAKDGRHVINIENQCLLDEEYKKDYFPFIFFRWGMRPLGFYGQGIAEQLSGIQIEINKILRTIQVSMHLVSIPKIFVEASSKVVSAHLNNKIGGIIKYAGVKPEPGQLGSIPPELFAHLDRLYTRCYEIVGVSQLSATASKPSGLNSGKALRIYNDIETERFMSVGRRYEQAFMDASKQIIDLAKEIDSDTEGGLRVQVKGKRFMETIKWSEVDLDEDKYIMQVFPTSALSQNPASRLQEVQELLQAGFVSKEDGMKLLNFPDLQAYYNLANAGVEDIERQMEIMIDKGEYQTPEPYQNLALGITKMQQAYLMYRSQNAPEDRLELFRRWISDAESLIQSTQQAILEQQQQQVAAGAPQLGAPESKEPTDLVPAQ